MKLQKYILGKNKCCTKKARGVVLFVMRELNGLIGALAFPPVVRP